MDELDRDKIKQNGWRFGVCFSEVSAPGLVSKLPAHHKLSEAIYVAATHDCSLVDPRLEEEPYVEYFLVRPLPEKNGNFTFAKNIRCLHLDILNHEVPQPYSIKMSERGFVDRASLGESHPDTRFTLPAPTKRILARWIANRYTTRGFPDAFNSRIRMVVEGKKPCLKRLFDKPESQQMLGVYLNLVPPDRDLTPTADYQAVVTLLYEHSAMDTEEKRGQLDAYAAEIKKCLSTSQGISVGGVLAMSEKDITLDNYRKLQQWQWDYISLRAAENDAGLIDDDLP